MSIGWGRIGEAEGSDHHCPSCFGEGAVISTLEGSDEQFRIFFGLVISSDGNIIIQYKRDISKQSG